MSKPSLKLDAPIASGILTDISQPLHADVHVTPVYSVTAQSTARTVIERGGAGSSKSYSICQHLLTKFMTEKKKKILILRKSLPFLRVSVYLMMKEIAKEFGILDRIAEEKVYLNWTYKDNLIHFGSVDDPEKIKCYHPDTEILTANGFVNIAKIKKGQLVATFNPSTGKAIYAPVKKTYVYDYNGYMYSPESATGTRDSHVGFSVTDEHKMIASTKENRSFRRIKITDLENKRFYVPRAADWKGNKPKTFTIPKWKDSDEGADKNWPWDDGRKNRTFDIVPWLKFLGWYLSEGCLIEKGWVVSISQTKEENRAEIRRVIKRLGYKYWENENTFYLCGIDLYKYLESLGHYCYEKRIPREVLELDKSLLVHLLDALVKGDGTKNSETNSVYYTTSRGLVDDVSELAIKIGLVPIVRDGKITEYQYDNARPFWIVGITSPNRTKDTAISKLCKTRYNGKVYCLTTEPYNTVMIRYNNRVMWCGQSSDWSYIWMEEATEFTYRDYQLLRTRLRTRSVDKMPNQMFLSFNPIDEFHWIKTNLLDDPSVASKVTEIHSTYLDNPFLDDDYVADLEATITQDRNFYRIYTLGEWGKLDNLIYNNWDIAPDLWPTQLDDIIYGIDFGYNAPTVLLQIGLKGKDVWERQLVYKPHLTNQMFIEEMKKVVPVALRKTTTFYADSAEPDRIEEIKKAGFNIKPSNKKVKEGIDFVKMLRIHVLESSGDVIKEKRAYSWRTDRQGRVLDEPVAFMDHAQDAERYGLYTHLKGVREYKVRWL